MSTAFNEIVTEAIEYILYHIWDGVTLEEVAAHCYMSVSHFSKIFKEQTGESVYSFIKRIKMEQSAMKLKMEQDRPITEIGEDYGYSASNYSTAFSKYHKKSPIEFRHEIQKKKEENRKDPEYSRIIETINEKIRIEVKPDYTVVYERTIGNYRELELAWCAFTKKHQDDIDQDTIFFERTFDDPAISDQNRCIYDICMTTKTPEKYPNKCVLEGGKFAVYPYKGYLEDIYPLNQQIAGIWFPNSGYELDERYSYDRYYLVREDHYMEFDICIPIK